MSNRVLTFYYLADGVRVFQNVGANSLDAVLVFFEVTPEELISSRSVRFLVSGLLFSKSFLFSLRSCQSLLLAQRLPSCRASGIRLHIPWIDKDRLTVSVRVACVRNIVVAAPNVVFVGVGVGVVVACLVIRNRKFLDSGGR